MALKSCPECKADIGADQEVCPHCAKKSAPERGSAIIPLGGGILLVAMAWVAYGALTRSPHLPSANATSSETAPKREVAAPQRVQPEPPKPERAFGKDVIPDGVYAVGSEFAAGIYRVGRYWERQDENQETIANDLTKGCPSIMVVRPSDAYVTINGGAVEATGTELDPISQECTSGTFLVGTDVRPGRYRLRPRGRMTYWARLNKRQDIIANDAGEGQRIVVVRKGDFALQIKGGLLEPM